MKIVNDNELTSNSNRPEKPKASRVGTFAVVLGTVAVIGAFAANLIPAYAGVKSTNPYDLMGAIFWAGLLGYLVRRKRGLSGGYGWLIGGVIGFMVFLGSSVLYGYQKAQLENEANMLSAQENIATANEQLPQMIDDGLRADRVSVDETGWQSFLTFTDVTADELDPNLVRREYKDYFASVVCETLEIEDARVAGAVFTYYFVDKNSNPVVDFTVREADCQ